MPVLTMIDTTGIQDYIFGSNRLRENIGASEIVARATSWWAFETLCDEEKKWKTNVKGDLAKSGAGNPFGALDANIVIEGPDVAAEVIYAGGGNTLILFKDKPAAEDFTKRYTRLLLARAPGLGVVIAHSDEFVMNGQCLIRDVTLDQAVQRVNEKKANRKLSTPLLGMAVTVKCISTGGVASFDPVEAVEGEEKETLRDKYGYGYVSAETVAKINCSQTANTRLEKELLKDIVRWQELKSIVEKNLKAKLEVPYDFDNLGRSEGEASFIAVVHTDGNGMGKRVKDVGAQAKNSREWINTMRAFSEEIYQVNLNALQATLDLLLARIQERKDEKGNFKLVVDGGHSEEFEVKQEKRDKRRHVYLPFRPLIFGGEDVAFVCDGRLGLALTAHYLEQIENQNLTDPNSPEGQSPMYARAGVAIVKSHYPFARAYWLAEDLARSAKARVKEVNQDGCASALDWHIAMTGLAGNVTEIREREYTTPNGQLNLRPLSLRHNKAGPQEWKSWQTFKDIAAHLLRDEWRERRNKVKALRDALREGEEATENFAKIYRIEDRLPRIKDYPKKAQHGWEGFVCVWFDAIEALDLFYPLENVNGQGKEGEAK